MLYSLSATPVNRVVKCVCVCVCVFVCLFVCLTMPKKDHLTAIIPVDAYITLVVPRSTHNQKIYFASAAVAVDSSHMAASSFTSWSRFSPPSNFVNGHVSTM